MPAPAVITPFRIVLLFVIATACGLISLQHIDTDWLPAQKKSQINISFAYAAGRAENVEQRVTALLEGSFTQLSQLKEISSASHNNSGSITLVFDKSADLQLKQLEVAALIRRLYPQLPALAAYPAISYGDATNQNNSPLLVYSVNGPQQPFMIKKQTERIFKSAMAAVPGIKQVQVSGVNNMQLLIEYDVTKCRAWSIEPSSINNSLQSYTATFYPGSISKGNGERYLIRVLPSLGSVSDLENILLVSATGQHPRLKDVARIFIEEQQPMAYFRVNGKNSVRLSITAHEGENKLALAARVKKIVHDNSAQLPQGYFARIEYDDTEFLQKEINKNYRRTALSATILLLFMLIVYRSWRYTFVLLSGLLVNLSLTATLAAAFGVDINLYTVAGLTIAFGIMTDNAIVMIDYYHKYRNRSFFLALLAASLIVIAALCLVFLLPDESRNNLADFAFIIVLSLISSLLVALWFTPGLYELVAAKRQRKNATHFFKKIKTKRAWFNRYYLLINLIATYRKSFLLLVAIGFGATLYLFLKDVSERAGYRDPEKTTLTVQAKLPQENTVEQMNAIIMDIEKQLSPVRGIDKFVTSIYSAQNANISISFKKSYENSLLPFSLKSKLIERSLQWGGMEWNIQGVGQAFNNTGIDEIPGFRISIKGYNYDEVQKQSANLAQKLARNKRVQKINNNDGVEYGETQGKELVLRINEGRMAMAGTNRAELLHKINTLSMPIPSGQYINLNNELYSLLLKEKKAEQYSQHSMFNDAIILDEERQARLKNIAHMELQSAASSIYKQNRQYINIVSFEYMGAAHFGEQFTDKLLAEMKRELPIGFTAAKESWQWDWQKERYRYLLIAVLVLSVFFICSILFENLKQPLYIISMIPLSFIGLFLIFSLGDFYFDQGGYAAFVMLGGLVANAAIYIVNDFNNLKKNKPTALHNRLLIKAIINRARTIILTVIATCCGLAPFLMEGSQEVFWFALAAGTIGGLLFSMLPAFLVMPVLLWRKKTKQTI
jgi:multidrug efflux pump subunit AcrB